MSVPVLPDFTRWQWAGVTEKQWFAPLFSQASRAFTQIERLSVVEGIRPAAWQFVSYEDMIPLTAWCQQHGVRLIPLQHAHQSGSYSSSGSRGQNNCFRAMIARPEHYDAFFPFDTAQTGNLLGYPTCCQAAFEQTWGQGQVDSTYEQLAGSQPHPDSRYASTLLRWMGVRFVPHMPCTYHCEDSIALGKQFADVGRQHGFHEEVSFMEEVLSWPVYWNRLFGIAEILTPALRITTRSDWTPKKQEFTVRGIYNKPTKDLWVQNGYKAAADMMHAHNALVSSIQEHIPTGAVVADLGCGNGMLLRRLQARRPDVAICGVDINAEAVAAANKTNTGTFHVGRIEDCIGWTDADVVILMPGRLLEMTDEDAARTRQALQQIPHVFVYTYADWKEPLESLTANAKLGTTSVLTKLPGVSVGQLYDREEEKHTDPKPIDRTSSRIVCGVGACGSDCQSDREPCCAEGCACTGDTNHDVQESSRA